MKVGYLTHCYIVCEVTQLSFELGVFGGNATENLQNPTPACKTGKIV